MKTRIKPARRPRRVRPAAETVEAPDHRVTLRILPVMPVPPAPSSLARPTFPPLGPAAVPAIASGGVPPPPADDQPARHVDVVALSFALELLSELRSMHGLQLLIEMRAQAERGQRPMTLGEALEFMIYRRGLSPAGSKKVMRQLIQQNLLIPAHSPCIDKDGRTTCREPPVQSACGPTHAGAPASRRWTSGCLGCKTRTAKRGDA